MSPTEGATDRRAQRFPRVSGDEPCFALDTPKIAVFSPRERG